MTSIDISTFKEEDLYDSIKLYGTLIKTIRLPKTSSMADLTSHNTYIIYDHCHRKYYVLLLASNNRYIAVADDLSELYTLLTEHTKPQENSSELFESM